jgi:hypothetical protein
MTSNPDFDAVMIKKTELDKLRAEVERLRAALAWYADFEHWRGHGMQDAETIHDCGEIARRVLERKP